MGDGAFGELLAAFLFGEGGGAGQGAGAMGGGKGWVWGEEEAEEWAEGGWSDGGGDEEEVVVVVGAERGYAAHCEVEGGEWCCFFCWMFGSFFVCFT